MIVKRMMSDRSTPSSISVITQAIIRPHNPDKTRARSKKRLDSESDRIIITITLPHDDSRRGIHAIDATCPRQAGGPAAAGHAQPASAGGAASPVSGQRLLRSRRPRPSKIRDAAPGPGRPPARRAGGEDVRVLAARLLPHPADLYPGGLCRPLASEARPEGRPQADRGRPGVRDAAAHGGSGAQLDGVGRPGAPAVPTRGASPQREKKRP